MVIGIQVCKNRNLIKTDIDRTNPPEIYLQAIGMLSMPVCFNETLFAQNDVKYPLCSTGDCCTKGIKTFIYLFISPVYLLYVVDF
jgi:hypothetical protein